VKVVGQQIPALHSSSKQNATMEQINALERFSASYPD
jgi:hypothetical protein